MAGFRAMAQKAGMPAGGWSNRVIQAWSGVIKQPDLDELF
jgi:hypothetical protein